MGEMKYWLFLLAKLLAGAGAVIGLYTALVYFYPQPPPPLARFGPAPPLFLHDMLFTFLAFGIWLFAAGLLAVIIWDQRRRCRTCLRRLIMPLHKGSWGNIMRFGLPKTEWICPYGHGTLSIEDLHITGIQLPGWQAHDDNIWKELESYEQARK
jgi:hypothetical protein